MVQRRGRDHEATRLSQEAPMNVGVWIPNCRHLATPEIIRSTAVRAEHLGYDSIWVSDHVVVPHANVVNFGETVFDPLVTLAVLAGATSRVRLGTTVLIVPYRNPVVTAKMVSSLDALSGGRFILGIGAGWVAAESVALGVPFADRGAMTDEAREAVHERWTSRQPWHAAGKLVRSLPMGSPSQDRDAGSNLAGATNLFLLGLPRGSTCLPCRAGSSERAIRSCRRCSSSHRALQCLARLVGWPLV